MPRTGVFISHAHEDSDLAESLSRLLKDALELDADDITCTSDADYGLRRGAVLSDEIKRRLDSAKALFLLATTASRGRDWVQYELAVADEAGPDELALYLLTPLSAQEDVVPQPYRDRVLVKLSCAEDLHRFIMQVRQSFGLPARDPAAYMESLLDLIDRARHAEHAFHNGLHEEQVARERVAHQEQVNGFDRTKKFASALSGVCLVLLLALGGVSWWAATGDARLNRNVQELSAQHAKALAEKDQEKSAALLDAQLASDREFKQFSLSGQLQDSRARTVPCSLVEAFVLDVTSGGERRVPPKQCDAAGIFTFSAPELQNDARIPVKLRVHVRGDRSYEKVVRLADARLAISLRD